MHILFLLSRFPYPLEKGDKLRVYHQMRILARFHTVSVFALTDEPVTEAHKAALPFVTHLQTFPLSKPKIAWRLARATFSDTPFQVAYFYDTAAQAQLNDFISHIQPDQVFCQLARMANYCQHLPPAQCILDYQDAFSMGLARRIPKSNPLVRPLIQAEYQRMQRFETRIFDHFYLKTIISDQDRQDIQHPLKHQIQLLPNGVDADYFSPDEREKTIDLLFTGNMAYPPNVDCVQFIAREVLPLLLPDFPQLKFVIAGTSPVAAVRALASTHITVTGAVPDMRTYYRAARVFLAPMQIGIGLQNKLLEAMASALPCVTSPLANNALQATHGIHLFVGDTPIEIAHHLRQLLTSAALRTQIGTAARTFVWEQYSWEHQNALLMEWMEGDKKPYK